MSNHALTNVMIGGAFVEVRIKGIQRKRRSRDIVSKQRTGVVDGMAPGVVRSELQSDIPVAWALHLQLQGMKAGVCLITDGREARGCVEKTFSWSAIKLAAANPVDVKQ